MSKKRGLGKGLGALIPKPASPELIAGAIELKVELISPNPHQPRQMIDQEKLQELSNSITEHGLIQPLIVTRAGETYQLIAGERRWRASKLAGLTTVPVIIKESSPQQMLELAIVENIQRADLNPLEEAAAYNQLIKEFGLTQNEVATKVGKSRTAVANIVRLINLPDAAKEALGMGDISEGHARAILSLKDEQRQLDLLEIIIKRGLNVRQTEMIARQLLSNDKPPPQKKRPPLTPNDKNIVNRFESRLGTRVELARTEDEAGKIVIHFYAQEQLQDIFEAILGEGEQL